MNKITFEKIRLATPFLLWFRSHLPIVVQTLIRPHLDQPQQLALNVLDCCSSPPCKDAAEISHLTGVTRETIRQVLLALKEGGMPSAERFSQQPHTVLDGEALTISLTLLDTQLDAQKSASEAATRP